MQPAEFSELGVGLRVVPQPPGAVAVGGVVTVLLQDTIGITEETAKSVVAIGIAWIVGDSLRTTE